MLCEGCKTDEKLLLEKPELEFMKWIDSRPPEKLFPGIAEMDQKKMNRIFLKKIEHHAECSFKSKQYLSSFC